MQQEIRFATFNVRNLALPGIKYYDDQEPFTVEEYDAKVDWLAHQIDLLDADVIGFQEIFSQAALRDVLARTRRYRQAHHIGFDPDPVGGHLTPNVALVSRLPLTANIASYSELPRNLAVSLPGTSSVVNRFTRPILHAQVMVSPQLIVNVFVCHLKSKRPDYRNGDAEEDPDQLGMAILRSLIRRGAEALGLRYLLTDHMQVHREPLIVMGDFNDVAGAISTQLVLGAGRRVRNGFDDRLLESYRVQSRRDPLRDVGYTHMHDGNFETVDHILVSDHFNPASSLAMGDVSDVVYFNDHIALDQPETSDHGVVLVRIQLYDRADDTAAPDLPATSK